MQKKIKHINHRFIEETTAKLPKGLRKKAIKDLKRIALKDENISDAEKFTDMECYEYGAFRSGSCYFNAYFVMMQSELNFQFKQGYVRFKKHFEAVVHCWLELEGHRIEVTPLPYMEKEAEYSKDEYLFFDLNKEEYKELLDSTASYKPERVDDLSTDLWAAPCLFNASIDILKKYVHPHSSERKKLSLKRLNKLKKALNKESLYLAMVCNDLFLEYVKPDVEKKASELSVYSPICSSGKVETRLFKRVRKDPFFKDFINYQHLHRTYQQVSNL
jgi:hypothetical protein